MRGWDERPEVARSADFIAACTLFPADRSRVCQARSPGAENPAVARSTRPYGHPTAGSAGEAANPSCARKAFVPCRRRHRNRPLDDLHDLGGISGRGAAGRFADHTTRGPRLHVERCHATMSHADKTILQLRSSPELAGWIPADRSQPRRPHDRPRIPSTIWR